MRVTIRALEFGAGSMFAHSARQIDGSFTASKPIRFSWEHAKLSFYMSIFQEDSSEEVGSATASLVAKVLAGQIR